MTKKEVKCECAESHLHFCGPDLNTISDGFHTFGELYEHRYALYIALCKYAGGAWRAKLQNDGKMFPGWFIMGLAKDQGEQITYHLPLEKWDETDFAKTFERSPYEFDGHTPDDVIQRLYKL